VTGLSLGAPPAFGYRNRMLPLRTALPVGLCLVALGVTASLSARGADARSDTKRFFVTVGSGVPVATSATVTDTTARDGTVSANGTLTVTPLEVDRYLAEWMKLTTTRGAQPQAIILSTTSWDMKVLDEENMLSATLTEIDLPGVALDHQSKDPLKLTVHMTSPTVRHVTPTPNETIRASFATDQKDAMMGEFRVSIDGIDCSKVTALGPISVTASGIGGPRALPAPVVARLGQPAAPAPSPVSVSNFVLTVPAAAIPQFQQWLSSGRAPKNGSLAWFTSNLDVEQLLVVNLTNLVVTSVTTSGASGQVTMSVGGISVTFPRVSA
jgi:hypothetical protein